jgi:hypothetical protein
VAEPNEAGTSPATTPVSENAGTGAGAGNGSESAAKPIDAGLLEAWKPKVEGYNQAMAERDAARQRIADLEARLYQSQAPVNPMAQTIAQLQEEAAWNPSAAASLQVLGIAAAQQAENNLLTQAVQSDVPKKHWATAMNLVRQSGYRMSFDQAAQLAQGVEAPVLHEQLSQKDEEIRRLREIVDGKTVGSNGAAPRTNLATSPAPVGDSGPVEMDAEEYAAIMRQGGDAARALRDRGVKFRR